MTSFDPNVFSCTAESFKSHVEAIERRFEVVTPGDLDRLIDQKPPGHFALFTFDDGYRDNIDNAVPALLEADLRAVFFVATALIGSTTPPWWDQAAFMVRQSTVKRVELDGHQLSVRNAKPEAAIREVLRLFKLRKGSTESKLAWLREKLIPSQQPPQTRLIMNWAELRRLKDLGMTVGSHTVTHPILAHLDRDSQLRELQESKEVIQHELQSASDMLAYPVGGSSSFDDQTIQLLKSVGYKYGFTTVSGHNNTRDIDPFQIRRFNINVNSVSALKCLVCDQAT